MLAGPCFLPFLLRSSESSRIFRPWRQRQLLSQHLPGQVQPALLRPLIGAVANVHPFDLSSASLWHDRGRRTSPTPSLHQ